MRWGNAYAEGKTSFAEVAAGRVAETLITTHSLWKEQLGVLPDLSREGAVLRDRNICSPTLRPCC